MRQCCIFTDEHSQSARYAMANRHDCVPHLPVYSAVPTMPAYAHSNAVPHNQRHTVMHLAARHTYVIEHACLHTPCMSAQQCRDNVHPFKRCTNADEHKRRRAQTPTSTNANEPAPHGTATANATAVLTCARLLACLPACTPLAHRSAVPMPPRLIMPTRSRLIAQQRRQNRAHVAYLL